MTVSAPVPVPGIYRGVHFQKYLNWDLWSQTTLKHGRLSMAHAGAAKNRELDEVASDDRLIGAALHVVFLERDQWEDKCAVWQGNTRRGHNWEAFKAEHAGKYLLTCDMALRLSCMVEALGRHPFVTRWRGARRQVEVSAVGSMEGLAVKGRADIMFEDESLPLIELKKTRSTDFWAFTMQCKRFGYDCQAAMYRHLFRRKNMVMVTVEDRPPFDVVAFRLSQASLELGERKIVGLIQSVKHCEQTGVWPGRSDEVVEIEVPDDNDNVPILIDGEDAF